MNNSPLVSAIIIFLNAEKFIQEALDSVFAQSYQNWELLLVDDGSIDQSRTIALQYVQQYPGKVRYLDHDNHQNRGTSASRNLGIDHAQGEYITFLDADDVWFPHTLEQQVAMMESHPEAAMTYGYMQLWYSWTDKPEDKKQDHLFDLGVPQNTLIQPPTLLINTLNSYYQEPGMGNAIIRAETFKKLGRFEERFRDWGEDKVFFAKVQLKEPVFVSGECWLKYRQHTESCCHRFEKDRKLMSAALQNFLTWLEEYLLSQGMKNTDVWQVLQAVKTKPRYRYRHSTVYTFWIRCLRFLMVFGRRTLSVSVRRWLWNSIGSRLHG